MRAKAQRELEKAVATVSLSVCRILLDLCTRYSVPRPRYENVASMARFLREIAYGTIFSPLTAN